MIKLSLQHHPHSNLMKMITTVIESLLIGQQMWYLEIEKDSEYARNEVL